MALTDQQIYTGLVYRKAVYNLITSNPFNDCFGDLKTITKSVLIEKMGRNKHTLSFEICADVFEYFDRLEGSLGFDESEWLNNVSVLEEFFSEVFKDGSESIQDIKREYKIFLSSLKENGLFHGNTRIPSIQFKPSVTYSSDSFGAKGHSGATDSSVPRMKYQSGATATPSKIFSKPLDSSTCYPINLTGKRGICLLVNIYRKNSFFDVPPARKIFEDLNYEVRVFDNVSVQEYIESLKKIREEIEKLNSDSFILIFSSHGDQNTVLFADRKRLNRTALITEFAGDYCPCLVNKPKLFFFQNCRGQEGHTEDTSGLEQLMSDAESTDAAPPKTVSSKPSTTIPSDVLRLYATAEGTVAYRSDSGSIFLQALYEILSDTLLRCLPIGELEMELRRRVLNKSYSTLSEDHKIGAQLPESTTSLTKTFYFCHPHP